MKLKITTAVLMVAAVQMTSALASTVNFSNDPAGAVRFADSSGNLLDTGSLIRIGALDTPGDPNSFREFANGAIGEPAPGLGGFAQTGASNLNATAFNDAQIYLWIYNSPTASAGADQAIFTAADPANPTGLGEAWFFPMHTGTGTDAVTIDLFAIDPNAPVLNPFSGALESTPSAAPGDGVGIAINLFPIPEPSTGMLSLLGLAGLFLMRRRS